MKTAQSVDTLHIASGHATTGTIAQAGISGDLSVWADVLHEGPVPENLDDDELIELRAGYVGSHDLGAEAARAEFERWDSVLQDLHRYAELVLWFEHDLFDQLNLIQLLDRLDRMAPGIRVALISIGSFPGRPVFKGMGELTPSELASLYDTRRTVTSDQYALARDAWNAFRSPDPRRIETLLAGDTSALPFLASALRRHLEEFPSTVNGLSRSEQRLLDILQSGEADIRTVFPLMHEGETSFYMGDLSFWNLARDLAGSSPPMVTMTGGVAERSLPRGTIAVTEEGQDVARGKSDRIRLCGIDRWLGGVHIEGHGPVWRWNPASARIDPPESSA